MCAASKNILNWPNSVSLIRILMVPVLFYLALGQYPTGFIIALVFTGLTDALDGFLARHLHQTTKTGSQLDSGGDFLVYSTMAIGAWLLWPDIILHEWISFAAIIISFTLPALIGFIKFKSFTSYHTWGVKVAVVVTYIGYILLFSELTAWPFRIAALISLYAAAEEIAITLLSRQQQVDVRSVWHILRNR